MFLYGTYLVSLDPELRLLLPAELRTQLAPEECAYAFPGFNEKLWIYPETWYEGRIQQIEAGGHGGTDRNELPADHMLLAMASRLELDDLGRIALPRKLVEICGLAREVVVVGVRDHVEVWNQADWQTHTRR